MTLVIVVDIKFAFKRVILDLIIARRLCLMFGLPARDHAAIIRALRQRSTATAITMSAPMMISWI
jgi:hypothetical protein